MQSRCKRQSHIWGECLMQDQIVLLEQRKEVTTFLLDDGMLHQKMSLQKPAKA